MNYAAIETAQRKAKILLEPTSWGLPFQDLHGQTDASGWELYLLECYDNFQNPFQLAMQNLYKQKGGFRLVLRDLVKEEEKGTDSRGRLHLRYVSHAGTEWERQHKLWAPKNGWFVPNSDCEIINGTTIPFIPGTLVPFETVNTKEEAIRAFEKYGLDPSYVSYFYRLDKYRDERFAGRDFFPDLDDYGNFSVRLVRRPSNLGLPSVASFPMYIERVMERVMNIAAK